MEAILNEVTARIQVPTSLPKTQPTQAYWQRVLSRIAEVQSPQLPQHVQFAVIGSGMTGLAAAKALLEGSSGSNAKVIVFEARRICSGATGRNGGHLKSSAVWEYSMNAERFGADQAQKMVAYQKLTCYRVNKIAKQYCPEESEIRDVEGIAIFEDETIFKHCKASVEAYKASQPEGSVPYEDINKDQLLKEYGVHGAKGAIAAPAGAMWPYRLVTEVWDALLSEYPNRLFLEALTPVESIDNDNDTPQRQFKIRTSRGIVKCEKVLHCTNGYASHLLPKLAGKIYPIRGNMTVQDLKDQVPNHGSNRSWGFLGPSTFDVRTKLGCFGLTYLTQNAKSGLFFFGGEKATIEDVLTDDDTMVADSSQDFLRVSLPATFGVAEQEDQVVSKWSGIMGFTGDGVPLVGALPPSVSSSGEAGEFVAAGFNGYGMPACWLAGEAIASLALGGPMPSYMPEPYVITELRLNQLTPEICARGMFAHMELIGEEQTNGTHE